MVLKLWLPTSYTVPAEGTSATAEITGRWDNAAAGVASTGLVNGTEVRLFELVDTGLTGTPAVATADYDVGAEAALDGTVSYSIPSFVASDQTSMFYAFAYTRSEQDNVRHFVNYDGSFDNALISRVGGGVRLHAGGVGNQITANFGQSVGYTYIILATVEPDGSGGSTISVGYLRAGVGAGIEGPTTFAGTSPIAIGGSTLNLFSEGFMGTMRRAVVAVGVAPDVTSTALHEAIVTDAYVVDGTFTWVADETALHTAIGKTPEIDIFGGAAALNSGFNAGSAGDLSAYLTGSFTDA